MSLKTKTILLAKRPRGELTEENFLLDDREVHEPGLGEVRVRTIYFSVDPYMRNRMNDVPSYITPYELNQPITGDALGEVIESASEQFPVGTLVTGMMPWQEVCTLQSKRLQMVDTGMGSITSYLGILGLTGLTAYFGLLDIGNPRAGESVVISGAAGAVGLVAAQIAKIKGCYVTGIAGSDTKTAYLKDELDLDEAINYKQVPNIRRQLRKALPQGVDVYFDNVGGEISDGIMYLLRDYARIILCGQISLYNSGRIETGPRLQAQMIIHRVKMQGFIVYDYSSRFNQARRELATWIKQGKLKQPENIIYGFENLPKALMGLFKGENLGKQLVQV